MPSPSIRILVVDDEPDLCATTKDFLERSGEFGVDTVGSVHEAMVKLTEKSYDVIVSGYQMPGKDGIQFLKSLRASGDDIPFILFTGKGREDVVIEALNSGADAYLQKGGRPEPLYAELNHRIWTLVKRYRAEDALRESEGKFRGLYDSVKDGIARVGMDGTILECNDAFMEMTGYTLDELKQLTYLDLTPKKWHDMEQDIINHFVIKMGHSEGYEKEYRRKDGSVFPVSVRVWLVKNGQGNPAHMWGIARDITERKQAEEAQRESESRYRILVDSANEAIVVAQDGMMRFVNPATISLTGISKHELISKPYITLIHPDDRATVMENYRRRTNGEAAPSHYVFRSLTKGGMVKWVEFNTVAIDWEGRPATLNFLTDITERKQAEEAQRESESRYRILVDSANEAIVVVQDRLLRFVNPATVALTGVSEQELTSTPFLAFIHPDDRAMVGEYYLARSKGEDVPSRYVFRFLSKEGNTRWVEISVVAIDWEGRPASLNFLTDVSERKQVENSLRESETRYRLLIDSANEAIVVAQGGMLRFVNPAALALTKFSEQELTSTPFLAFIHPDDRAMVADRYRKRSLGEPVPDRYVFRFVTGEGTTRWVEMNAVAIEWEWQPATLNFLTDITERKQVGDALLMANRKLNLLSSITRHDINNQTVALEGHLALLEMRHPQLASDDHLKKAERAAGQISAMIQFTKTYEDIGVHVPTWHDVQELLVSSVKDVQLEAVKVINDVPVGTQVFADPLIVKVFQNLVHNAIRHGGKMSTIRFYDEELNGAHTIVCEDDGTGIPADMKEKLFSKGFGKDHGLGLFLSREILSITGIAIAEMGEPGQGAKFVMTVPPGGLRTV